MKIKPEDFIEMLFESKRCTEQIEPKKFCNLTYLPQYKLITNNKEGLDKLGRLEDILEEFNITSFKELREILKTSKREKML